MAQHSNARLSPPFSPPGQPPPPVSNQGTTAIQPAPRSDPSQKPVIVDVEVLKSLPTISRTSGAKVYQVEDDIETFVRRDLDVSRLNRIHPYLWMAGRPLNARTLQRQKMMGLHILTTEQADLHLLKFTDNILIKPLPEYTLSYDFWEKFLCASKELHENACGLLLSYVWLICSPLDMKMAHELDLLPPNVTWPWWKTFVADFLAHIDANALDQVNKRYHFGELRLGRINTIYRIRFFFTHFIRGYLYGYNRYEVFFQRNFAWLLVMFAYFSLILSAMQVGTSVPPLSDSHVFQRASYGFVVFSIFSVAFFLVLLGAIYSAIFFFNMAAAILHSKRQGIERTELARSREGKRKDA